MYIPKNKIINNLYTRDNSFIIKKTKESYNGPYHKTSEGKYYTGKTPNDSLVMELEIVNVDLDVEDNQKYSQIALFDSPTIFDSIFTPGYNESLIVDYNSIKGIDPNSTPPKLIPSQHYPKPNENDYTVGYFTRFFCVKINENKFIELDKDTYNKILGKDSNYLWELYTPFKLKWTIKGEISNVVNVNKDITLLTEKRIKRKGLDIFLRKNYLKYYE